jgi:hypothetical protein
MTYLIYLVRSVSKSKYNGTNNEVFIKAPEDKISIIIENGNLNKL